MRQRQSEIHADDMELAGARVQDTDFPGATIFAIPARSHVQQHEDIEIALGSGNITIYL